MLFKILLNSQENTRAPVSFFNNVAGACKFIKKEILAQVFSCTFCEIFKNNLFTEHVWTTASVDLNSSALARGHINNCSLKELF